MPGSRLTFSLPLFSIIPAGFGALMLWAFFAIFDLLGYTNCPTWKFLQSAPRNDLRIIGTLKKDVYLQAPDGTIYCNAQNQWKVCRVSTFGLSRKDAPDWLSARFTPVPEKATVKQLTRAGNYATGNTYFVLLEDNQIWSCPDDFNAKIKQIASSGAVIWLIIPAGIGLWCCVAFMQIFIKYGSPTIWDFFGRGTKVK